LFARYRHAHQRSASRQRPIGIAAVLSLCVVATSQGWIGQAQEPVKPVKGGMGGIASAGTFAPVYDAEKRPITAGGIVDTSWALLKRNSFWKRTDRASD
jgi:hypothetical protein